MVIDDLLRGWFGRELPPPRPYTDAVQSGMPGGKGSVREGQTADMSLLLPPFRGIVVAQRACPDAP
jgi:hypothetical protein